MAMAAATGTVRVDRFAFLAVIGRCFIGFSFSNSELTYTQSYGIL